MEIIWDNGYLWMDLLLDLFLFILLVRLYLRNRKLRAILQGISSKRDKQNANKVVENNTPQHLIPETIFLTGIFQIPINRITFISTISPSDISEHHNVDLKNIYFDDWHAPATIYGSQKELLEKLHDKSFIPINDYEIVNIFQVRYANRHEIFINNHPAPLIIDEKYLDDFIDLCDRLTPLLQIYKY